MQVSLINSFTRLATSLCIALLISTSAAFAQTRHGEIGGQPSIENAVPDLIRASPVDPMVVAPAVHSREAVRSRLVALDVSVLENIRADVANGRPQIIRLALFDDTALLVQITRTEAVGRNGTAYIGVIAAVPHSSVVMVEESGVVSGNVALAGRKYQIRHVGDVAHVVRQIDSATLPPDHPEAPVAPAISALTLRSKAGLPPEAARNTLIDDGSIIDVMVVYTTAARLSQGSTAAMKSLVNLAVTETNNAYANSQVTQRLRLVYAGEVDYTEVDFPTDLARLQGTSDGFMDDVHRLRDLYAADLVSLWGNYAGGCGLSNLMLDEKLTTDPAFSVVDRNCATSNYSFAHEIGHNMGLQHDIYNPTSGTTTVTPEGSTISTAINYAHGYVDMPNRFRTVMAISAQCDAQSPRIDCVRIAYFSNPGVSFNAAPTGNVANAQEFKALNDTRDTTANFRTSVDLTGPGTVIFLPANYSVSESAGTVTLSVARHAGSSGAVSINFSTANGSATAGVDYVAVSGVLAWAAGETGNKTITVPITQNGILTGPQAFTLTVNAPTGGVSIGAPGGATATATVTILEADTDSFPVGCSLPLTGWANPPAGTPLVGWAIANDSVFGPPCSLKSTPTANAGSAQIQFTGDFIAGNVSFARRVSSQSTDCLRFFIDISEQSLGGACSGQGASGEVPWAVVSLPITAGTHTLRWSYEKAAAGAGGADAAWIDRLVLPLAGSPLIQSAPPSGGFLNIAYVHTFFASGSPTITYTLSGTLPPGLSLSTAGVISGTPAALGTYTAFVTATNNYNNNASFVRQYISITITGAPPSAPIIGTATPGNGQASIAFGVPASAGSTPISSFTASCNPNGLTVSGAASPVSVTGMVNGTEYTCAVTATNDYGTSASSAPVLVTPRVTRPAAPAITAATAGSGQAFISFMAPGEDGGSPITVYTATCNPAGLTATATVSPLNVASLSNGTTYLCSLTATNAIGTSIASAPVAVMPAMTAALTPVVVWSRKLHGAAGTFDLPIDTSAPVGGALTVEPRSIGAGHTVAFHFNYAINAAGSVTVIDGGNANVPATSAATGNDVLVTIPRLADAARVSVSVTGVNGTSTVFSASLMFLLGDINNSHLVDGVDISGVRARSGQPTTATNFKFDVNTSGTVSASDISTVKARLPNTLR